MGLLTKTDAPSEAPLEEQWEYKARNLAKVAGMSLENDFNKFGQQGWEFVAMATGGSEGYAIFKRRKPVPVAAAPTFGYVE